MVIKSDRTAAISNLESLAKLMDSKFKIPGTNIRFGLDSLLGLIPGAGDFTSFIVSGYIVTILAKHGASGYLVARMIVNILIDTLFGSIPFLGDIFDVAFKANQRNIKLMKEHYIDDRHKGSAWKLILPLMVLLLLFVVGLLWVIYKVLVWLTALFV